MRTWKHVLSVAHSETARFFNLRRVSENTTVPPYVRTGQHEALLADKSGVKHGFGTVQKEFQWSEPDHNHLQVLPGFRAVVHSQATHAFNVAHSAWPWAGIGMVIRMLEGSACIVVLGSDHLLEAGTDVEAFLRKADHATLKTSTKILLRKDKMVWIPFGCVPLIMGVDIGEKGPRIIEKTSRKGKREEAPASFVSFVSLLAFRPDADKAADAKLRANILATHHVSRFKYPASFKADDKLKAWTDALA